MSAGKGEEVLKSRSAYQEVMSGDLTELVERKLDRKVIAFLSANHLNPDVAVEFFLLADTDGARGQQVSQDDDH